MKPLLLLRPEPGLSASASRAEGMGLTVLRCPLFRVEPVAWEVPDPDGYDLLLLTSANAIRHGGPGLEGLRSLPALAVGKTTAEAAREAGFTIDRVGSGDVVDLLSDVPASAPLLHLAGEDRGEAHTGHSIDRITVYRSAATEAHLPSLDGLVIAVHSPRAGARLDQLATERGNAMIAAISAAAAAACGPGWSRVEFTAAPSDDALLALAASLCQTGGR